jgi:hypothetical protein
MSEDIDESYSDYLNWEPSHTFCEALDGDYASALKMWRQVATGDWDNEAKAWCQEVARSLLDAANNEANKRPGATLKAVRLGGDTDLNSLREIDEICLFHMTTKNLDAPEKRGEMVRTISAELLEKKLVRKDDNNIDKLISRRITLLRRKHPHIEDIKF